MLFKLFGEYFIKERHEIQLSQTTKPEDIHLLRLRRSHAHHLWRAGLTMDGDTAPRDLGGDYIGRIFCRFIN